MLVSVDFYVALCDLIKVSLKCRMKSCECLSRRGVSLTLIQEQAGLRVLEIGFAFGFIEGTSDRHGRALRRKRVLERERVTYGWIPQPVPDGSK